MGGDEFGQLAYALAFTGLQNLAKYTHVLTYPTGRHTLSSIGLRVLTWSFTPHLPAAVSVRHAGSTRLSGDAIAHFTGSRGGHFGHPKAGLTSKPRHAQRQ